MSIIWDLKSLFFKFSFSYKFVGVTVNAPTGEIRRAAKKMSIVVKDGDSSNSEKREFIKFSMVVK